jgi:hypothetical protein
MNTNSNLNIIEDTNMITIDIDIESQSEPNEENLERLDTPLRGILKNPDANRDIDEIFEARIVTVCTSFVLIIVSLPFIICDLYFGFTENNCSTKEPRYNKIEKLLPLKIYLLVSGFMGIISLGSILTAICLFDPRLDKASFVCLYGITFLTMYITSLFSAVWNALAAITFWGFIFNNQTCETNFTSYIFISLIIKLISSICVSLCSIYSAYNHMSD